MSLYCFLIPMIPFGAAIIAVGLFSWFSESSYGPPEDCWFSLRDQD